MLSISGSNSRKSVSDWTLVNIYSSFVKKAGSVCESDSLLVSLMLSEKPPNTCGTNMVEHKKKDHEVGRDNVYILIYGFS